MGVMRIGSDRLRAMQASQIPKSPEYLRRRSDEQRVDTEQDRHERQTLDPQDVTPPCTARLVCPEHDEVARRHVECRHELADFVSEVADAHAAPYGGRCGESLRIWFGDGQDT